MKLAEAFGLLPDIKFAVQTALWPTLVSIWQNPFLLLQPRQVSQIFMNHMWVVFGAGVDENSQSVKKELITPYATGVVLDLGAAHGHTVKYLNHSKVTKYVALEPNVNMHKQLRVTAAEAGYSESNGTFQILSCGAEDTSTILSSLNGVQVDTIISILTICSVPDPQATVTNLVLDVLKPRGQFLYYEHVLSPLKDVAWWQRFWTPLWAVYFDGCRLDRPTHLYVEEVQGREGENVWKERKVWGKEGESDSSLFWHRTGRHVKE